MLCPFCQREHPDINGTTRCECGKTFTLSEQEIIEQLAAKLLLKNDASLPQAESRRHPTENAPVQPPFQEWPGSEPKSAPESDEGTSTAINGPSVTFNCGWCRATYKVKRILRGRRIPCKHCRRPWVVGDMPPDVRYAPEPKQPAMNCPICNAGIDFAGRDSMNCPSCARWLTRSWVKSKMPAAPKTARFNLSDVLGEQLVDGIKIGFIVLIILAGVVCFVMYTVDPPRRGGTPQEGMGTHKVIDMLGRPTEEKLFVVEKTGETMRTLTFKDGSQAVFINGKLVVHGK